METGNESERVIADVVHVDLAGGVGEEDKLLVFCRLDVGDAKDAELHGVGESVVRVDIKKLDLGFV